LVDHSFLFAHPWAGGCSHILICVLSCAAETYRIVFRMKDFGSATKKPTMLLANSRVVCRRFHKPASASPRFLKGVAKRRMKAKSLCRRYTDSEGRARFVGTPRLKGSQILDFKCYLYHVLQESLLGKHNVTAVPFTFQFSMCWKPTVSESKAAKSSLIRLCFLTCSWSPQLRTYPVGFAKALVQSLPAIRRSESKFQMEVACHMGSFPDKLANGPQKVFPKRVVFSCLFLTINFYCQRRCFVL
jgi:hypothetical protein